MSRRNALEARSTGSVATSPQVHSSGTPWIPEGFDDSIQTWDDLEKPPDALRSWVVEWIFTRLDDAYQGGMKRESGFPQPLAGVVPGTVHGDGMVVVCSSWVLPGCVPFPSASGPGGRVRCPAEMRMLCLSLLLGRVVTPGRAGAALPDCPDRRKDLNRDTER
jgi:hypothetical protein